MSRGYHRGGCAAKDSLSGRRLKTRLRLRTAAIFLRFGVIAALYLRREGVRMTDLSRIRPATDRRAVHVALRPRGLTQFADLNRLTEILNRMGAET